MTKKVTVPVPVPVDTIQQELKESIKDKFDISNLTILTEKFNGVEQLVYNCLIAINNVLPFNRVIGVFNGYDDAENSLILSFDNGLKIDGFYDFEELACAWQFEGQTHFVQMPTTYDAVGVFQNRVYDFMRNIILGKLREEFTATINTKHLIIDIEENLYAEQREYVNYFLQAISFFLPYTKVNGVWYEPKNENYTEHSFLLQFDNGLLITGYNVSPMGEVQYEWHYKGKSKLVYNGCYADENNEVLCEIVGFLEFINTND